MKSEALPVPDTAAGSRRHDLDALRAVAMLLGIAYHFALSFAAGFPWLVEDSSRSRGIYFFQAFVHGFRMPLFMLVSGFFTAMLWRKKGLKALVWHRFRRVLLPCLLGLVTILPAMNWVGDWASESGAAKRRRLALAEPASASVWAAIRHGDAAALTNQLAAPGAVVGLHPAWGTSPLIWAALVGPPAMIDLLIDHGAPVNGRSLDGGTALHAAAFLGRADVAAALIRRGADVRATNTAGDSVLHAAGVDYGIVQYLAGALSLTVDRTAVETGRTQVIALLREHGLPVPAAGPTGVTAGVVLAALMNLPIFGHLWFLWILWWMVLLYAAVAWIASRCGWRGRPVRAVLSPARLLWVVPLTLVPQWFMGFGHGEFGPDTALGLIPLPHVFAYYAVFFGFGALYFDSRDDTGRLGAGWRWSLPLALVVVLPLAVEFSTGTFGWRDALLPARFHQPAAVLFGAVYAWVMSFGAMGLFRSVLPRENAAVRYLSDASYWCYLAHLPLTVALQVWVRDWPGPAWVKLGLLSVVLTGFLLFTYQTLVRYTPVGTLLNGRRTRPGAGPVPATTVTQSA